MPDYDFQSLSPREFEFLARDLLQEELCITLETFREGKDSGIDLRYAPSSDDALIVQCKRYDSRAYNRLKNDLEKKELEKVQALSPQRYILFTSVKLSPQNKGELLKILQPYCLSTSDIYGIDDVNNLLGKFSKIEQNHFKLWLTSTPVLERVLSAKITNFSNNGLDYIKRHYSRFVVNSSVRKADKILENNGYCIIAGQPGIGKTTLAHVLLSQLINDGFELVSISHDISEAWNLYKPNTKQVFYYDDFLGQTSLKEKLEKNEDDRLIKLIELCGEKTETFFLLTTREYILNQAAQIHEKISRKTDTFEKCIIQLEDYTKLNRAEILYNHIFFSDLEIEKKKQLLEPDVYLKILNHNNYNPRLIEDITQRTFIKKYADLEFKKAVISYFDNPTAIWSHAFNYQLSDRAKTLLLVLATLPKTTLYEDLEAAFEAIYTFFVREYGWKRGQYDYKEALKELDGSLIKITLTRSKTAEYVVEYENPSVRDFIENHLAEEPATVRALYLNAVYFSQAKYFFSENARLHKSSIHQHLQVIKDKVLVKLLELNEEHMKKIIVMRGVDSSVTYVQRSYSNCQAFKLYYTLKVVTEKFSTLIPDAINFTENFIANIDEKNTSYSGLCDLSNILLKLSRDNLSFKKLDTDKLYKEVAEQAEEFDELYENAEYLFRYKEEEEIIDKIYNAAASEVSYFIDDNEKTEEDLTYLSNQLQELENEYEIPLSGFVEELDRKAAQLLDEKRAREMEDEEWHWHRAQHSYYTTPASTGNSSIKNTEDNEIADMFRNLKEVLN